MNKHAETVLEFRHIRRELEELAFSEGGRKLIAGQDFLSRRSDLEKIRVPSAEFRKLLAETEDRPSFSFPDIEEQTSAAEKPGAALDAPELARVAAFVRQAKILKSFLERGGERLSEEAADLPDLTELAKKIGRVLDQEGNVKDGEIPSLASIRQRIRTIRRELESLSYSYLGGSDYRGYWQTDTPTEKDGRLVLPLNANYRGRLRGVVHEVSSRGATIFFEPVDIFEKNNALVDEENEYRLELFRILRDLTAEVGARAGELRYLSERVAVIDSWHARARYSGIHDCFPAAWDGGRLVLKRARHPLLGRKAVPIDVEIGEGIRILIVTGPNTGGKTVALKTVGLLALMNQFGLDVPADLGSALPLFDDVFADIGDEQSIAESLSTFSAHVRNLSSIVLSCTPNSLVLLDELGSDTDPEEGAALAMAFLDRFLAVDCISMVTTHLGVLKNYGFTKPNVSNASVDFDVTLLRPTYRIVPGIPGSSHALEIAEQQGIPRDIVENAKAYVDRNETDASKLIRNLIEHQRSLTERTRDLDRRLEDAKRKEEELAGKEESIEERERELRKEGLAELNRFLSESRKEFENLVREIREGELTKTRQQAAKTFTEAVKQRIAEEEEKAGRPRQRPKFLKAGPLEPGMEVYVGKQKRRGVLIRRMKEGRWLVSAGALRLTLAEDELMPAAVTERKSDFVVSLAEGGVQEPAKLEIDLRGMRADEALKALEKQIDRALMQGLAEFGVIHGKGEGILQRAVQDYLSTCPAVGTFGFASPEAGGSGKTLVSLKR